MCLHKLQSMAEITMAGEMRQGVIREKISYSRRIFWDLATAEIHIPEYIYRNI